MQAIANRRRARHIAALNRTEKLCLILGVDVVQCQFLAYILGILITSTAKSIRLAGFKAAHIASCPWNMLI
jgi:hypothetical protein